MMYTPTPDYYNDYLAHYGIKGMKWKNHIYKTLQGRYIGAKFAARKKLQALDKQYRPIKNKIKKQLKTATGNAVTKAKAKLVKAQGGYYTRRAKDYISGTANKIRKGTSITRGRARAALNTQGVKSQAKYLKTKYKNKLTGNSRRATPNAMKGDSRYRNNNNLSAKGYAKADSGQRKKLRNTSALRKDSRYRVSGMSSKSAMRKDSRYKKRSAMKGDRRYRKG